MHYIALNVRQKNCNGICSDGEQKMNADKMNQCGSDICFSYQFCVQVSSKDHFFSLCFSLCLELVFFAFWQQKIGFMRLRVKFAFKGEREKISIARSGHGHCVRSVFFLLQSHSVTDNGKWLRILIHALFSSVFYTKTKSNEILRILFLFAIITLDLLATMQQLRPKVTNELFKIEHTTFNVHNSPERLHGKNRLRFFFSHKRKC